MEWIKILLLESQTPKTVALVHKQGAELRKKMIKVHQQGVLRLKLRKTWEMLTSSEEGVEEEGNTAF